MRRLLLSAALVLATASALPARAAPIAPADQIGLDLRRTTLVVKDTEASLRLYRDALGLVSTYDHVIRTPDAAKDDAASEKSRRLVLLRANDDYIGALGLLEYFKPALAPRPARDELLRAGDMVLVFNTKDLQAKFEKVKAVPGIRVSEAPHPVTYPSYDGKSVIHVMFSSFYDPDGNYVELNEVLDPALH